MRRGAASSGRRAVRRLTRAAAEGTSLADGRVDRTVQFADEPVEIAGAVLGGEVRERDGRRIVAAVRAHAVTQQHVAGLRMGVKQFTYGGGCVQVHGRITPSGRGAP